MPMALYDVPVAILKMAGSPARNVVKPTKEPPSSIPTVTVEAVEVDRFCINARPGDARFTVEMLTAFVETI